jgi:glycosyltransferase involved in cell wall biosynthesis
VTDGPRILLVTKGLDLGGLERVVVDLALGLCERGIDVEVAVVNSERDRLVPPLTEAGVVVHRLGGTDLIGPRALMGLVRLVRGGRCDVVHVHGPLPGVAVRLAALGAGPKVITTSHTPWPALRPATRWPWRATAGLDAATIAVSSVVAASLPSRVGARALVIPHGVDPQRIDAAMRAAVEHRASIGSGAPVRLVTVASHRDAKDYPNLLRGVRMALDDGADVELIAIGDGPGLATHVELAASMGLNESVTFLPPDDDVLEHIAAADVLVVASDYEGQPIVVAEALALGIPVVGTAVGRVPEMVTASVGRVVAPRDPAALAHALREVGDDPELRSRLSVAARRTAARTLGDVIDAHLGLYAATLDSAVAGLTGRSVEDSRS